MVLCLVSPLLSFIPRALQVLRVLPAVDHVDIEAELQRSQAACPACGSSSGRLHSRYWRVLGDLPWQGRPVTIRVAARRFRCLDAGCKLKTFSERLGEVAMPLARRTRRLGDLQRHVALALGGEAGARLAERVSIPASPDTLLRMAARAMPGETLPPIPKVLGVDDWAWRRGHHYGTILVDLERNEVVDLLPDRQAETLADWLRQHPGIEVVARDRAGAYADGVRQGAPDAVQVADRWHLLRNLGDAVRAVIDRHHAAIRQAVRQNAEPVVTPVGDAPTTTPDSAKMSSVERRRQESYARRQARYEEAARLRAAGVSVARIARAIGAERKTIRRWLRAAGAPLWRKPIRATILAPYHDHLDRRWIEGCHNGAMLWREIVQLGYSGRSGTVRKWATKRRNSESRETNKLFQPAAGPEASLSGRKLARLLTADINALPTDEQAFVSRLLAQVPSLTDTIAVAKKLNVLLRRKSTESLTEVLDAAVATPLKEFAASLRRDLGAVQAALDLPWTTSPVEGQINRLKMLKRTMYGRAGFQLLRKRVLNAT
jgi:transposase